VTAPLLQLKNVTRRFGGLVANSGISFDVRKGEIIGLIGPNGAGKTTLFNVLVGIYPPTEGEVIFDGRKINGLKPHKIAKAGLTKTFQNVALFAESSVLDNVVTGGLVHLSLAEAREFAMATLERVGIGSIAHKKAGDLSFPERARVEVARALCTSPKLLLLDEVMAALTPAEMEEVIDLVRGLRDDGMTFIVVEHHMKAVMKLCERLIVLNFGQLIADAPPEDVTRNEKVLEAYLGANFSTQPEAH
jgi:ABC-type branched-chain amino acid transport systems, ATPase component